MSETSMTRISLAALRKKKDSGEIASRWSPSAARTSASDFWAKARRVDPLAPRSVRLNLDPDVFDYFKSLGKGHLTHMQNVLKAYADAHKKDGGR
jgi:uncharacterized protein (DUF4415 family)